MAHDIRCSIHNAAIPCAKCLAGNNTDSKQGPERIRLVTRGGGLDGRWYYTDAAIARFDTEIGYVREDLASRASVAAPEGDAVSRAEVLKLVDVCTCGSSPEWRSVGMRHHATTCQIHLATFIRMLPAAASSSAPAEQSHLCLLCGHNGVSPDGTCLVPVPICENEYHGTRRCGCKCRFATPAEPLQPEGEQEKLTVVTVGSSRHPHFTHADHERMKATLDALSDNPTEEEAEAVLQACGTSGKEVVNEFIEQLLRERSEMQAELDRLRASPPATPADAARNAAREWMNTHHASFETNKEREDALAAIITRNLAGTATPEIPADVEPRICLKCGHEERHSDNEGGTCEKIVDEESNFCGCACRFAAPVTGDDEGEK